MLTSAYAYGAKYMALSKPEMQFHLDCPRCCSCCLVSLQLTSRGSPRNHPRLALLMSASTKQFSPISPALAIHLRAFSRTSTHFGRAQQPVSRFAQLQNICRSPRLLPLRALFSLDQILLRIAWMRMKGMKMLKILDLENPHFSLSLEWFSNLHFSNV